MPNRDQNRAATIDPHQPNFREFFESRDVVADLLSAGSNHLTEMLREWNNILQHSSLGQNQAQNTNERKDERVPRDGLPAVGRRRKIA